MMRLPDGTVLLEKGEVIPVDCVCGSLYKPALDSECSECPDCGKLNLHEQHLMQQAEQDE